MESMTVTAPDISCDHCRDTVERAIGSLGGVHTVSVDVPTKQVNVSFDPVAVSRQVIVAKLDEEGYPVSA